MEVVTLSMTTLSRIFAASVPRHGRILAASLHTLHMRHLNEPRHCLFSGRCPNNTN